MKSADLCAGEAFKALNAYRKACKCDDSSGHEVVSAYMMLSIMMASQIAENGSLGVAIGFLQSQIDELVDRFGSGRTGTPGDIQ